MPHRFIAYTASNVCELIAFTALAFYQGGVTAVAVLTENDWGKVFGPNGVAFVSVIACIILWGTFITSQSRSRKDALAREEREEERRRLEDEARERRHLELVRTNKENADDLKGLTAEAIKAQLIAAAESKTLANNHQMLSINVHNLVEVIKKSPCLAVHLRDLESTASEFPRDSRL